MTRDALRWITAGITLVQIVLLGATAPPALAQEPAAEDAAKVQFSGKQIHTWVPKPGMRIFLVVDSFVISWGKQKVASRDGVLWFDEARAKATGELVLGVYAEGNVVIVLADGDIVRRNIAYITIRSPGELVIDTDEDLRGSAAGSELFARANKTRQANVPAADKDVVEVAVEVKPVAPTVKIIPQDDKRKVTFSSEVIGGERVSTWTGGVYVLRGDMELGADSIVIWAQDKPIDKAKPGAKPAKKEDEGEGKDKGDAGAAAAEGAPAQQTAAEAYLEGHVTIRLGDRTIYASRVFYDFRLDRAIILDGKIKTFDHNRGIPIYYYAKKIRQVARGAFQADDAKLTTCEFGHPHYDLGARRIIMIDMTDKPLAPKRLQHVVFSAKGPTTRVRGVPVMWWPRVSGEIEEATSALRSARISNSSHRGTGLETEWNLFRVLGLERRPPGYDLFLELDAWSERGPAIGIKGKYERELYYGNIESYFIHDSGEDRLGGGADMKPPRETRGRIRWQHRKYFEEPWQNWELTLEFTHLSDVNFLNEFFEREFKEDKTQETVLYLKRQVDNKVVTILVKPRVVDFLTVTEYYPRVDYMIIGRSLLNNRLTYFTHNELAVMRYLPNKNLGLKNSPATFVGDTKHELDWPLAWGPVKIVPYAEVRGTYFSDTMAGGEEGRAFGAAGIRLATQLWKTFEDVESEFWNVHRLRHVNTFEAYFFTAGSSVPSRDLWPFDVAEAGLPIVQGVDGTDEIRLLWRQRFQTMRGIPGKRRSVDWISVDVEGKFYFGETMPKVSPEGDTVRDQIDVDARWVLSEETSLLAGFNVDVEEGETDTANVGLAVTHSPRMSYYGGVRFIGPARSTRATFDLDYVINTKWRMKGLYEYDFEQDTAANTRVELIRRLHRWFMTIGLQRDEIRNITSITVELQPMGAPEIKMGL